MNRYLAVLIIIWWAGALTATVALFVTIYNDYLVVGAIGWGIVAITTALIFIEMRRIKKEDRKKEELRG